MTTVTATAAACVFLLKTRSITSSAWSATASTIRSSVVVMIALSIETVASVSATPTAIPTPNSPALDFARTLTFAVAWMFTVSATITVGASGEAPIRTCVLARVKVNAISQAGFSTILRSLPALGPTIWVIMLLSGIGRAGGCGSGSGRTTLGTGGMPSSGAVAFAMYSLKSGYLEVSTSPRMFTSPP